jgi:hypothetical protein
MRSLTEIPGDAQFFRAFVRFEYALKEAGYYWHPEDDDSARFNWRCFARKMSEVQGLFDDASANPSIKHLIDNPPERRVVGNRGLEWRRPLKIRNTRKLLGAVQRVRNNLFHGDKSAPRGANDLARNEQLIRASMEVLRILLERCADVAAKFNAEER